jgi:MOSC domain-containing protein YiiM
MAGIYKLFIAPRRRLPMQEVAVAEAVANFGFAGCAHARRDRSRQLLLVDSETLEAMNLAPGVVRENITTTGLNVNGLQLGEKLHIGPVVLEVSAVCTPCDQLERVRPGLRREMYGRRGMLCRILTGGPLCVGDAIVRVRSAAAASSLY